MILGIGSIRAHLAAAATEAGTGTRTGTPLDLNYMVQSALLHHGADPLLAARGQTIVSHVSHTVERADPLKIHNLIHHDGYLEFAIIQDADRLDALGAVGIGRCFTFLGAQGGTLVPGGGEWELGSAIGHFGEKLEKLEKLEGLMKTGSGREMAMVRTQRLGEFRGWWEEMGLATASADASP